MAVLWYYQAIPDLLELSLNETCYLIPNFNAEVSWLMEMASVLLRYDISRRCWDIWSSPQIRQDKYLVTVFFFQLSERFVYNSQNLCLERPLQHNWPEYSFQVYSNWFKNEYHFNCFDFIWFLHEHCGLYNSFGYNHNHFGKV